MNLYFEHSDGSFSLVVSGISREDAFRYIEEDVYKKNPNYKIYYIRETVMPNNIWYDIGSHTESYHLTDEEWKTRE